MKPIALTMGEPAGIGGEIAVQAWNEREKEALQPFFLIDSPARIKKIAPDVPMKEISTPSEAINVFDEALPILSIDLVEPSEPGVLNVKNAQSVIQSIEMAVDFVQKGAAAAVVTNPIHKAVLYETGFNFPGHTEFLASLCDQQDQEIMMLACAELKVVPLTIHIPIKDVAATITQEKIIDMAERIHHAMRENFAFHLPRLAIAGLNPHAGEDGSIGKEDQDIILPAIQVL